jgi:hypothetical protein
MGSHLFAAAFGAGRSGSVCPPISRESSTALFCAFRASTPSSYAERAAVVVSSRADFGFDFLALPIRRDRFKRAFERLEACSNK